METLSLLGVFIFSNSRVLIYRNKKTPQSTPTFQSIKIMNSNTNVNYLKLNPYFSHYSNDIGVWVNFLMWCNVSKNIFHVYRSIICGVEYNQCCVYSKINTYEALMHHRCSGGVCSKNNWNTECILNMWHTPIFENIVL